MRIVCGLLAVLLLLFAVVQYNDPDAALWIVIYGVAAIWPGLAAASPVSLTRAPLSWLFFLSIAAAIGGVVWYWPTMPNWWMRDVWWNSEASREGMGMMIVIAGLACAAITSFGRRPRERVTRL